MRLCKKTACRHLGLATLLAATALCWIPTAARGQAAARDPHRSDARDLGRGRLRADSAEEDVPDPGARPDRSPRESSRGQDRDSRRAAAELPIEELRAADLGLWFDRQTRHGLVISDVATSGAIAQFGFREGDQIVSINGLPVRIERDFVTTLLADETLHERVPVVVLRGGRRRIVYIRPDVFIAHLQAAPVDPLERFGVELDDRYATRIVVWRVLPRSPAYYAGIRSGDIISTFDGQRIFDAGEFVRLIDRAAPTRVELEVNRGQQVKLLDVDLAIAEALAEQPPVVERPMVMDRTFDDIGTVDPHSDRRLRPRPDVPPGMRIPGGEVGRDRGPISPAGAALGTPTAPPVPGFSR